VIDLFEDCNFFTNSNVSAPTWASHSLYLVDELSPIGFAFIAVETGETLAFWISVDYLDCLSISMKL